MAKTKKDVKRSLESKVNAKEVEQKNDYITLNFKGLPLPWAILLSVIVFTAGIGSSLYFGLKARPVATPVDSATTPTKAPTYAADEFPEVTVALKGGPQIGDKNAKVVILEFSDLLCPYCKQFHDASYGAISETYIKTGKATMVYKHYPLSFHEPAATLAAKASYCVEAQYGEEKMFAFNDLFFANSNTVIQNAYDDQNNPLVNIKEAQFYALFSKIGVNQDRIKTCMKSSEATARIKSDEAEFTKFQDDVIAKGLAEGLGTPSFVVGTLKDGVLTGRFIDGAYPVLAFKNVIDEQLKK